MWVIRKRNEENLGEMIWFLNVRLYGDCGTPSWRCPGDSQIFENKYYSSCFINVVNIVNLGSKSLDSLTLMIFSGLHFTITVMSVQLLSVWIVKVQFGSLTSVFSHGLVLLFIAVSLLWDHWDFMSLHTAFHFQSLKTLYCYFFFYLVQMPKNPVQFTYVLVHMSSFPCYLIYPSADS